MTHAHLYIFGLLLISYTNALAGMKKLFLVQISNRDEVIKIKVNFEKSPTFQDAVNEVLRDIKESPISVEFYSPTLNIFCNPILDELLWIENVIRVNVVMQQNMEMFLIKGREFDILKDGLLLSGFKLQIDEKLNRSEGTGLNTWDGSIVLSKYLEYYYQSLQGKLVLELGSGTGVAGIAAFILGAKLTILSDLSYTIDNLVENVKLNADNFVAFRPDLVNSSIGVAILDWADSSTYIKPDDFTTSSLNSFQFETSKSEKISSANRDFKVQLLYDKKDIHHSVLDSYNNNQNDHNDQNDNTECAVNQADTIDIARDACAYAGRDGDGGGQCEWDIILGADIVWVEDLIPLLVQTVSALCGVNTVFILAHQVAYLVSLSTLPCLSIVHSIYTV